MTEKVASRKAVETGRLHLHRHRASYWPTYIDPYSHVHFYALALIVLACPTLAENRIALLIGNQDYKLDRLDLRNPHNDGRP